MCGNLTRNRSGFVATSPMKDTVLGLTDVFANGQPTRRSAFQGARSS